VLIPNVSAVWAYTINQNVPVTGHTIGEGIQDVSCQGKLKVDDVVY
jgi:hypothetical protein